MCCNYVFQWYRNIPKLCIPLSFSSAMDPIPVTIQPAFVISLCSGGSKEVSVAGANITCTTSWTIKCDLLLCLWNVFQTQWSSANGTMYTVSIWLPMISCLWETRVEKGLHLRTYAHKTHWTMILGVLNCLQHADAWSIHFRRLIQLGHLDTHTAYTSFLTHDTHI